MTNTFEFINRQKNYICLLAVIILAGFLRFYNLSYNPNGFFCDEASIGVNAYSLLKSGKDEWGNVWPLFFKAFGEYKNPIQTYTALPLIFLGGLNEFSVRSVSVLYSLLGIIAIFLLGRSFYGTKVGLASALLLAICPWSVHISRNSLEGLMAFVFFTTIGLYFWHEYFNKNNKYHLLLLATISLTLALYSYFPARIFIPPLILFLLVSYSSQLNNKRGFIALLLLGSLTFPMIAHSLWGQGMTRWEQVSSDLDFSKFIGNYLNHYSLDYLFFKGDIGFSSQFITRHSVKGIGELYSFQLPFLIIGLFYLFRQIKKKTNRVLLFLLLTYPIADSLTSASSPQATRSIIGLLPLNIITALGIINFLKLYKGKILTFAALSIILVMTFSFGNFIQKLNKYPLYSSDYWGWQSGPKEIIAYFMNHQSEYSQQFLSPDFNSPYIFYKFYDPQSNCSNCLVGGIDEFVSENKQLFAIRNENLYLWEEKGFKLNIIKQFYYPNGEPSFALAQPNLLF
jgi:4-amino-4-deoxy-L-arabinose transferase-like glycosyltransferase